jgi:hypothetical protein
VVATLTASGNRLARRLHPAAIRQRLATRASTTPGRLILVMTALAVVAALAGLAAVVGAAQRAGDVEQVAAHSGPLTVQAQQLYRSLSDADATAAAAFLSSGEEPAELRARYQSDIAAASSALADVTEASTGTAGSAEVDRIAQTLPVYTGLVETARTYNRLNLPVAGAYLREASGLMRERLLPAAQDLYRVDNERLATDRGAASALPWLSILLIVLLLAGLILVQRYLTRHTRRLINIGLASATAAGLVAVIWLMSSWLGVLTNLSAANRDGSAQVAVVVDARIAALQARADEALTLVARGSGADSEISFGDTMKRLSGEDGNGGLLLQARSQATDPAVRGALVAATKAVSDWRAVHTKLHGLDQDGQYPQAVTLAIGDPAAADGDPASAAAAFNRVDQALADAIAHANATFDDRAGSADGATTAAAIGLAILIALSVGGLIVGLQQRIAEYR